MAMGLGPWGFRRSVAGVKSLEDRPLELLFSFARNHREFEEFIAATYEKNGFTTTLTPSSGDLGRDIIAEKQGWGAIRLIDQCKAFDRGRKVSPNDVRAMMGTLLREQNASKAVISTTSTFAPSVRDEWRDFMPYRLELREGSDILDWLKSTDQADCRAFSSAYGSLVVANW
jgi:restriction system protein